MLSLAVSISSNLCLLVAMSRNRLRLRLALGVFLCMEYNRNRRINFVGKGVPLVGSRHRQADCCPDSSTDTFYSRPQGFGLRHVTSILVREPEHPLTSSWNLAQEDASVEKYNAQFF